MPYRVTFVCSGNICRSPMAEAVLRHLLTERGGAAGAMEVDSYGLGDWHVGERADPRAMQTLQAHGYALDHRARVIEPEDIADHDLVVAIDRGHERALLRMALTAEDAAKVRLLRSFDPTVDDDPDSPELDIPDPYYGGPDGFEHVLAMVENGCRGLLDRGMSDEAALRR